MAAAVKKHWPQAPRNIVRAFIPHSKELIARFDAAIAALDACILRLHQAPSRHGFRRLRRAQAHRHDAAAPRAMSSTTSRCATSSPRCSSPATRLRPPGCAGSTGRCRGIRQFRAQMQRRSRHAARRPPRDRGRRAQASVHRPGHRRIAAPAFADPFHLARRDGRQHRRRLSHPGRRHGRHFHVRHPPPGAPLSGSRRVRSLALHARERWPRVIALPTCRLPPAIATASAPARRWWSSSSSSRASRSASSSSWRRATRSSRLPAPPCSRATA